MGKKPLTIRLDENILLDIRRLERTRRYNSKTHVVENALEKGLKILKKDTFSKY